MDKTLKNGLSSAVAAVVVFVLVSALLPERSTAASSGEIGAGVAPKSEPAAQRDDRSAAGTTVLASDPDRAEPEAAIAETAARRDPSAAAPALAAPTGTVVFGRVTSTGTGEGVQAAVEVLLGGESIGTYATDDAGRFASTALAAGGCELRVSPRDGFPETCLVVLAGDRERVRVDVAVDLKQKVRVRIIDAEGEPSFPNIAKQLDGLSILAMAFVPVATRDDPGAVFDQVSGSLNNTFGIGQFWQAGRYAPQSDDAHFGTVTINERGPAWISLVASHQVIATQRVAPHQDEVTFELEPADLTSLACSLSLTLLDAATAEPIEGTVYVGNDPFPNGRPAGQTDADGQLRDVQVLPGRRWLVARVAGYAMLKREIHLARGERVDLGVVELHRPIQISGTVRDASGTPRSLALRWGTVDPQTGSVDWVQRMSADSAGDGTYRIPGLEPGIWAFGIATANLYPGRIEDEYLLAPVLIVDATGGDVTDADLRVAPATFVTCRFSSAPTARSAVLAIDASGHLAGFVYVTPPATDGMLALLPGSYEFQLKIDGAIVSTRAVTVGAEALELTFDL